MVTSISPQRARELIDANQLDLVDVREDAEWSKGHVPGARHVPLGTLRSNLKGSLPRDGVIFVCAAGVRSQTAARLAEQVGLTTLYSVIGGVGSWLRAGLPLVVE